MNLTDLTEVLRRHAELPPDAAHGPRMSGIQARVKASRRRRAAVVAASLVAVLGVAFAFTTSPQRESQPAEPEPPVFSEYHEGTRIVAQTSGQAPTSTIALRFVPTTLDTKLFTSCHVGDKDKQLWAEITVNGRPTIGLTCGVPQEYTPTWASLGVEVGTPTTVVLSVGEHIRDETGAPTAGPVPPDSTFTLAAGVPVAPEDYPFPPRPESLASVDSMLASIDPTARTEVVRADPDQPNGTWQTTVTLPADPVLVTVAMNTPGRIRVLVNGVEVHDHARWTYVPVNGTSMRQDEWERAFGLAVAPGDTVDVTVIAERTSGDWAVVLRTW